jgi:acetyl-CoA acetyltransferase
MMRAPAKDTVAFVGIGTTGFSRHGTRSSLELALEASTAAIRDAGLTAADIDGVVAIAEPGAPTPVEMVAALGLPEVTHISKPAPVVMYGIIDAMAAVHSGCCDTALVCAPMLRLPWASRSAAADPFRARITSTTPSIPESIDMAAGYAAWASRYLHETGASRTVFGRVAVNSRTNAAANPLAVLRDPMSLDDHANARMIREPLGLLDMDLPVDGADAFVVTTVERARRLPHRPVLIHATSLGLIDRNDEDQLPSLARHGQHVVVNALRAKSDIWIDDIDLFYPYDGFTNIAVGWIENCGWCEFGQAERYLADAWVAGENRLLLDGRVPVNTHGGSLSEGGTRGTGHVREAIMQLRGAAGDRQVAGARTALVTPGGFFFNSQGAILRS